MTWDYAFTPHIWPSIFTILLLIALAVYAWRRRSVAGVIPFTIGCLLAVLWMAGSVMELTALDPATKIFWFKFQSFWQLPSATASTCFVLEYAWPGRWLTRRNLVLLSIAPLLLVILVLTNDLHQLAWSGFIIDESVVALRGPGIWLIIAYGYGLGILNLIVLVWLFLRSPQHHWPAALMITGQIMMRAFYFLQQAYLVRSSLPLDVIGLAFVDLMYAIALFGFRIFDPIPLARQTAIEQLREGMLVLDAGGRVASLNPAAERILGATTKKARGKPVKDLLPTCPDGPLADPGGTETELSLGSGQETRSYLLEISRLNDFRGLEVGRLLLLHDVTGQKQAQAQLLEQQRALATLNERERLARELHDSLGQVLGYISLQAQAIAKWAHQGETAVVEAQLLRLVSVAQAAHTDLRESILSLRTDTPTSWSFLAALQQNLAAYQENYGIRTELSLPSDLAEADFDAEVGVQLMRVIQEALTNTRKHAQARNGCVSIAREGAHVTITVADDGVGFNPEGPLMNEREHFGLGFMRERMDQVGGSMTVRSKLGGGTQVIFRVPLNDRMAES